MTEYNVTTIPQLASAFNGTITVDDDYVINILNDLDFNNDGYYYHESNFFSRKISSSNCSLTVDGGQYETDPSTGQTVLVKNSVLSNIYMYPRTAFFYINTDKGGSWSFEANFKNIDFEVVVNQSSIFGIKEYATLSGYGSQVYMTFENCNFNIKVANNASYVLFDGTNFEARGEKSLTRWKFINCTFNIEYCNSNTDIAVLTSTHRTAYINPPTYNGYSDICSIFESCEFRIKSNVSGLKIRLCADNNVNKTCATYINNCAFFLNSYYNVSNHSMLQFTYTTNTLSYIYNSFFAAFADTPDGTIDPDYQFELHFSFNNSWQARAFCCFYDKQRLKLANDVSLYSGSSLYDLTTAECKSEAKLKEIGFLFATET